MIRAYLDTSVVAAWLAADPLSETVVPALSDNVGEWWVSSLVGVELASVMARRARDGLFTPEDARIRLSTFDRLVQEDQLRSRSLAFDTMPAARELLLNATVPLRSLDALHLAIALDLQRENQIDTVWTGDRRMAEAAETVRLPCRLFTVA